MDAKTKLLMVSSAAVNATLGLAASFLPREIASYTTAEDSGLSLLLIQAAGALYLGFAFLNWMLRGNPMGGIYGRPVVVGNLLHFVVMAIALWKAVASGPRLLPIVVATIVYTVFAVWFGLVMFATPYAMKAAGHKLDR